MTKVALVGGRGEDDAKSAFTIKFEPTSTSFVSVAIDAVHLTVVARHRKLDRDDILAEDEVTSLLRSASIEREVLARDQGNGAVDLCTRLFLDLVGEHAEEGRWWGGVALRRNRKKDAAAAAAADGEEASLTGIPTPTEKEAEQYNHRRVGLWLVFVSARSSSILCRLRLVADVLHVRLRGGCDGRAVVLDEENENTMPP